MSLTKNQWEDAITDITNKIKSIKKHGEKRGK